MAAMARLAGRSRRTAAVGAPASIPATNGWTADADDQFLLEVHIRQLRLGEGVRAYATPEGTCIVFGDFLTTLDVPMKIDLTSKKASGWAFKEQNRIAIDVAAQVATYRGTSEPIAAGTVRETPQGWCVETKALARWFGIGVKPMTSNSAVFLESEAKLPVEMAIERQTRAAQIRPAKFDLSALPQVQLPYRMWRAPALDFVVSGGVTYRARTASRLTDTLRPTRRARSPICPMTRSCRPPAKAFPTACACAPTVPTLTAVCSGR